VLIVAHGESIYELLAVILKKGKANHLDPHYLQRRLHELRPQFNPLEIFFLENSLTPPTNVSANCHLHVICIFDLYNIVKSPEEIPEFHFSSFKFVSNISLSKLQKHFQ
jgi:Ni2+-binding GTPase involved in maturation of urease and hydrogenase